MNLYSILFPVAGQAEPVSLALDYWGLTPGERGVLYEHATAFGDVPTSVGPGLTLPGPTVDAALARLAERAAQRHAQAVALGFEDAY